MNFTTMSQAINHRGPLQVLQTICTLLAAVSLVTGSVMLSVLWLVNYSTRHIFNKGSLVGVKTIHFARWVAINEDRRMIFASNYDGSVESYNDDFIDKIGWGLNAVFSNGVGYPSTRWLLWGGASDENAFKTYLRLHQEPTQVWYPAYPTLTALNIANNAAIRRGLLGGGDETAWLLRL